jgi:hypothetical protein
MLIYQYFKTLIIVTQCVLTMICIESYMHIFGDNSDKCQQWQWELLNGIFVKSKKKSRYKRRLGMGSIRSNRFKRILVIMAAGHQMMAMSNIINKNKIEPVNNDGYSYDTDRFPIKIDNCCTQTMSGYRSDFIETSLKSVEDK